MSATAVPASACLSATPICSSVNPFLAILRASFPGASLPEKLRWDWIRIWGEDQSWLLDLSILLEPRELQWCKVPECTVGPSLVVVDPPFFNDLPGVNKGQE